MNIKRIVLIILIIINCSVIFIFSAQEGEKSSQTSGKIVDFIYSKVCGNKGFTQSQEIEYKDNISFVVRKCAHFSIYTCLGILAFLYMNTYEIKTGKKILYSFLFCFAYACSDELHQKFSNGRSCEFRDVMIDSIGALCGSEISNLILKIKKK